MTRDEYESELDDAFKRGIDHGRNQVIDVWHAWARDLPFGTIGNKERALFDRLLAADARKEKAIR